MKKVKLQTLQFQFEFLQMETSEPISIYISRVLTLTNQIRIYGEQLNDQVKVEKILQTLTSQYEHIVVDTEEAHDLSQMLIDVLIGTLQAHEQHMNEKCIEKSIK